MARPRERRTGVANRDIGVEVQVHIDANGCYRTLSIRLSTVNADPNARTVDLVNRVVGVVCRCADVRDLERRRDAAEGVGWIFLRGMWAET